MSEVYSSSASETSSASKGGENGEAAKETRETKTKESESSEARYDRIADSQSKEAAGGNLSEIKQENADSASETAGESGTDDDFFDAPESDDQCDSADDNAEDENASDASEAQEGVQRSELTEEQKAQIKEETGWSDEIIDHIDSMEQYEIYKKADLEEREVNGRKCLCKKIDLDYVDPKTGKTNRQLMESGRSPIDSRTGEKIQLHHMGQDFEGPFVELCELSEHKDGNHAALHPKSEGSWRNDPEKNNLYNNIQRPEHWRARAKGE